MELYEALTTPNFWAWARGVSVGGVGCTAGVCVRANGYSSPFPLMHAYCPCLCRSTASPLLLLRQAAAASPRPTPRRLLHPTTPLPARRLRLPLALPRWQQRRLLPRSRPLPPRPQQCPRCRQRAWRPRPTRPPPSPPLARPPPSRPTPRHEQVGAASCTGGAAGWAGGGGADAHRAAAVGVAPCRCCRALHTNLPYPARPTMHAGVIGLAPKAACTYTEMPEPLAAFQGHFAVVQLPSNGPDLTDADLATMIEALADSTMPGALGVSGSDGWRRHVDESDDLRALLSSTPTSPTTAPAPTAGANNTASTAADPLALLRTIIGFMDELLEKNPTMRWTNGSDKWASVHLPGGGQKFHGHSARRFIVLASGQGIPSAQRDAARGTHRLQIGARLHVDGGSQLALRLKDDSTTAWETKWLSRLAAAAAPRRRPAAIACSTSRWAAGSVCGCADTPAQYCTVRWASSVPAVSSLPLGARNAATCMLPCGGRRRRLSVGLGRSPAWIQSRRCCHAASASAAARAAANCWVAVTMAGSAVASPPAARSYKVVSRWAAASAPAASWRLLLQRSTLAGELPLEVGVPDEQGVGVIRCASTFSLQPCSQTGGQGGRGSESSPG